MDYQFNEAFAKKADELDPLKNYRNDFFIPQHEGKDTVYFTGNSLGLQPKKAKDALQKIKRDTDESTVLTSRDVSIIFNAPSDDEVVLRLT